VEVLAGLFVVGFFGLFAGPVVWGLVRDGGFGHGWPSKEALLREGDDWQRLHPGSPDGQEERARREGLRERMRETKDPAEYNRLLRELNGRPDRE
jgi:hypothetical protein